MKKITAPRTRTTAVPAEDTEKSLSSLQASDDEVSSASSKKKSALPVKEKMVKKSAPAKRTTAAGTGVKAVRALSPRKKS